MVCRIPARSSRLSNESLLKVSRKIFSLLNILSLSGFVSTCKEQDELLTVLDEIDSVAWAELNPKF
jgi:hypothetical protein